MTALTALRPRRLRPALVLATAAAVVATSYAASTLHVGPFDRRTPPAAPAVVAGGASQPSSALPAPRPPFGTAKTPQQIDHALSGLAPKLQRGNPGFYPPASPPHLY